MRYLAAPTPKPLPCLAALLSGLAGASSRLPVPAAFSQRALCSPAPGPEGVTRNLPGTPLNYNSRHATRELLCPASPGNGYRTTLPGVQRVREPLVSLNRGKKGTPATKLTFDWLILRRHCRLGAELCPEALMEHGGALGVRRCQKKLHVDSLRGATQRILVSIQVKWKVRRWVMLTESEERN